MLQNRIASQAPSAGSLPDKWCPVPLTPTAGLPAACELKAAVRCRVAGIFALCLLATLGVGAWRMKSRARPFASLQFGPSITAEQRVRHALSKLPIYFIENRGQLDARVAYYVQGAETSVYFTSLGLTFTSTGRRGVSPPVVLPASLRPANAAAQRWAVNLEFVGSDPKVTPRGRSRGSAIVSYFKGPRETWKTGLATYSSIVYANLWPGIDLQYSGAMDHLKYEYIVQPGTSVDRIRLRYRGATYVGINAAGQIEVRTPLGIFRDDRPYAYQEIEGRQVRVEASYEGTGDVFGFRIGAYDRNRPLIIDPAVLVYAGFLGGSGNDVATSVAVDESGNAYVTGFTPSTEPGFPVTAGPDLTYNGGDEDAFVAKVNAEGTGLIYAGYIGGSGKDEGYGIAVDRTGNAYVTGAAGSDEHTFPVAGGPGLTYGGEDDAFIAKVNADGTGLIYAGYIGGSNFDYGSSVAVDNTGSAYVTGYTGSNEFSFPVTAGPDLTFNGGDQDAFVAKVNPDGTALVYAGYIGGSGAFDRGQGIAVDRSGNAYVAGRTNSTHETFPVTVGPDLTFNGLIDAFVAKVNSEGTALLYAGYIGGAGNDQGLGITIDRSDNAYVTGFTNSTTAQGFPAAMGPDTTHNGGNDAFVAKVNPDGTALLYAGYVGGSGNDQGHGIAVDCAERVLVTGFTSSTEATFPVVDGPDLTHNGGNDAFVARVNVEGTALIYAGYLGGTGDDQGRGIAVDNSGNAYVAGRTDSTEASFPAIEGPDLTHNGSATDAFVAKILGDAGTPPKAVRNAVRKQPGGGTR